MKPAGGTRRECGVPHVTRRRAGAAEGGAISQLLSAIGLCRSASAMLSRTLRRDLLRLRRRNHLRSRRDHDVGIRLRQVDTFVRLRLLYRRRRMNHIWLGDRYRLVRLHRSVPLGGPSRGVQGDELSGNVANITLVAREKFA